MIGIGGRQHQHSVRRRFLEGFEKAILGGLGHALGIGRQRDARRRNERLEAQELLKGLVVRGPTPFGMNAYLVDADRLRPIITPEVGVHLEPGWLSLAEQQLLRQRPRYGSLAYPFLTDQAIGMREPARRPLGTEHGDGPLMTCDGGESACDRGRGSTRSRCWHCLATLTSLSLTRVSSHSYAVGVSNSETVNLGDVRRPSSVASKLTAQPHTDGCGRHRKAEQDPGTAGSGRQRPERHQRMPLPDRLRVCPRMSRHLLTH